MNKEEALKLLNEEGSLAPDNRWISHSICVGDTASVIAEKLNLDKEKARVLGYIHDIGKRFGSFPLHDLNGFNYIKELGYSDEYANICLTHSYLNNDYLCTAGSLPEDIPFRTQFIKNHSIYTNIYYNKELPNEEIIQISTHTAGNIKIGGRNGFPFAEARESKHAETLSKRLQTFLDLLGEKGIDFSKERPTIRLNSSVKSKSTEKTFTDMLLMDFKT